MKIYFQRLKISAAFLAGFLFSFGHLKSQEIPYLSSFIQAPWNTSLWETSYSIPRNDPRFLDAIAIPFQFPMETSLVYSYARSANLQTGRVGSQQDFRMQDAFSSYPTLSSQNRGLTFLYRKKNFGLNLDLSLIMAGSITGMNFTEARESKARFSYRVPSRLVGLKEGKDRLDLFLELSELQILNPSLTPLGSSSNLGSALFRSGENSNRPGLLAKQVYASPGISLSRSSSFIFEGQVRVPMNAREANRTLDELWTPEIQTHLGMKYIIPVTGLE